MDEKTQYLNSAVSWLYENEIVDNPQLLNHLYLNIFSISKRIKDVELVINSLKKHINIYLEFDFLGKLLKSESKVQMTVSENLKELLPKYHVVYFSNRNAFEQVLATSRSKT